MNDRPSADVEELFQRALVTSDEAYLMAEAELREAEGGAEVFASHLQDADPMGRLLARVMLDSEQAEAADSNAVLEYLDYMGGRFARTLALTPPIPAVVDSLSQRFGGRLAEFLALRLVQERQPDWRGMGAPRPPPPPKNPPPPHPPIPLPRPDPRARRPPNPPP